MGCVFFLFGATALSVVERGQTTVIQKGRGPCHTEKRGVTVAHACSSAGSLQERRLWSGPCPAARWKNRHRPACGSLLGRRVKWRSGTQCALAGVSYALSVPREQTFPTPSRERVSLRSSRFHEKTSSLGEARVATPRRWWSIT